MTLEQTFRSVALSITVLVAPSASAAEEPSHEETIASRIDALVRPQAEAELLSGVIRVSRGEEILFERAYGFSSWELRVPNSVSTRFGVASLTKSVTETLVHLLVEAGRLDLEAPVERYLPGFPKGPEGGVPTLRHLLTHRSGVPHRVTEAIEETQVIHPADIVARVQASGLLFEPGTRRLYSSAGFTCLARVIEVVEKSSFEQVLAERVLRPAAMTSATGETGQRLMSDRALPYRLGADERQVVVASAPYKDLRFLAGAGSLYATAQDLSRFVDALRGGVFGTDLRDQTFDGDAQAWHGWTGRTNGYEASVDVLPAEDLTFVFLSNLQTAANWQAREQIQSILLGQDASSIPFPPPVAAQFEDPESLVGSYGPAEISLVEGRLLRGDNEFYPIDGGRYYIPASGTIMRFRRGSTGTVDAIVVVRAGGQETVLPRSAGR